MPDEFVVVDDYDPDSDQAPPGGPDECVGEDNVDVDLDEALGRYEDLPGESLPQDDIDTYDVEETD